MPVIVPGPSDEFVALSRSQKGRLFKKHILNKGTLHYNGKDIPIDDKFFETMEKNFKDGVCPIVQIPVVGDDNNHTEDPLRNIGEVVGLEHKGSKLYAILDIRDDSAVDKIGKTLLGTSAMFSMDYKDTRTDKYVGPTLLHTAITNRPHEVDLDDYEELISMSADGNSEPITLSSIKESTMDLDEILSNLKEEHNIDVLDLQQKAEQVDSAVALSAQLTETLGALNNSGIIKLSNSDAPTNDDVVAAVAQLGEKNVELSAKVDTLIEDRKKEAAEKRVDDAVRDGFILPAKRDAYLTVLLSNEAQFEALLPEKPVVALSGGELINPPEDEQHKRTVEDEIARLSASSAAKQYIH